MPFINQSEARGSLCLPITRIIRIGCLKTENWVSITICLTTFYWLTFLILFHCLMRDGFFDMVSDQKLNLDNKTNMNEEAIAAELLRWVYLFIVHALVLTIRMENFTHQSFQMNPLSAKNPPVFEKISNPSPTLRRNRTLGVIFLGFYGDFSVNMEQTPHKNIHSKKYMNVFSKIN